MNLTPFRHKAARWLSHALLLALLLGALAALAPATPARAAGPVVTNTNDSGAGSLRQAISDASSGDTITFDPALNGQTIGLTSGLLLLDKILTIQGPGADKLTISGSNLSRHFDVTDAAAVTIADLKLTDGDADLVGGFGGSIFNGGTLIMKSMVVTGNHSNQQAGAIQNQGKLTIINSTLSDNDTSLGGGAIANFNVLDISESTISGNTANTGGGIAGGGLLTISNSTISGNRGDSFGGGIASVGTIKLLNSTVTNNVTSRENSTIGGGGIALNGFQANITISGSIVAGNIDQSGQSPDLDTAFSTQGLILSLGNNVIGTNGSNSGFVNGVKGDQVGTNAAPLDPKLGPLANNGGSTRTHLPLVGSPAIDKGGTVCPSADQRGVSRPQGAACDVGAVEVETVVTPPPAPTPTISVVPGGVCFTGSTAKATINLLVDPAASTLTASSSNQAQLPDGKLLVAGSGPERTLTLTAAGTNGQAQITLTASAGGVNGTTTVNVLVGTSSADTIIGTSGNDVIFGLGANDTLNGGGRNDLLCGGSGNNTLSGGDGDDTLITESGSDTLSGGAGDDLLISGKGTNILNGDAGNDTLVGGDAKDTLNGGDDNDTLTGAKGGDSFSGGNGTDVATDFNPVQGDKQDGTLP